MTECCARPVQDKGAAYIIFRLRHLNAMCRCCCCQNGPQCCAVHVELWHYHSLCTYLCVCVWVCACVFVKKEINRSSAGDSKHIDLVL